MPVTKTPIPVQPDILYSLKEHGKHTLFNGTKVVQTRICCNNEKVDCVIMQLFSNYRCINSDYVLLV